MTDRYSQLVNAPVVATVARQLGLPQPVDLDRHQPGDPVVSGPVLSGAAPGGRLGRAVAALLDAIKAERAGAEGQAKALVFDATGIADSTELVELQRFFYPAVGAAAAQRPRRRPRHAAGAGRLGPRPHRAAGAGGLHPLARQGDRRPRLDRAARLRRPRRRGPARLDPALPALAALGLRLRPGGADRQGRRAGAGDRLGAAAGRQDRPWSPAPRAGSAPRSRRPWPATAPSVVGLDVPQAAADLRPAMEAVGGEAPVELDITAADAPERIAAALRRRASTSSSTTPASPATGRSRRCPRSAGRS